MFKNSIIVLSFILASCVGNSQKKEIAQQKETKTEKKFKVTKTEAEWEKSLTQTQFYILRKAATENPFTSEWLDNKEKGVYVCVGCGWTFRSCF